MLGRKTTTTSVIFAFAAPLLALAQTEYFPLEVGNQWMYQTEGRINSGPVTIQVREAATINGETYYRVTGFPGNPLLLRFTESGVLVNYDESERRDKPWVAFTAKTGEAFATEIDPCNGTAVIRTRNAEVKTEFGEFDTGLEVGYNPARCADAGLTRETFLPGIGLAERRYTTIAGEQVLRLVYARTSAFTSFAAPDWSFQTSLNKAVYRSGEAITARLTLRNTTENGVSLTFPSGQDYDLILRNDKGESVYNWLANKAFPLIFRGDVRIAGERNWLVVTDNLPRLAPGVYTATGSLATTQRIEATVTFRVEAGNP